MSIEEAREKARAAKLAQLAEWDAEKRAPDASARGNNTWVPPHRRSADAPAATRTPATANRDAERPSPRRAPGRPEMVRYMPPRLRREVEERERHEAEEREEREAEARRKVEEEEAARAAALEAAREAGEARVRGEAEARAKKDAERRQALAEKRSQVQRQRPEGQQQQQQSEAGGASAPAASTRVDLACVLEARSAPGSTLRPRDVTMALPAATRVVLVDGDDRTALVLFGSAPVARQALGSTLHATFKLYAVDERSSTRGIVDAAHALGGGVEARPRASGSAATRLIAHSIELSAESRAAARELVAEKREQLQATREQGRMRAERERQRKKEIDAVWDGDD